jgi:putative transcriptional regulator
MPVIDYLELADVRKTQQCLELSQAKLAAKLEVSFQRDNCWKTVQTKPLLPLLKQTQQVLHQLGESSKNLLTKHFLE